MAKIARAVLFLALASGCATTSRTAPASPPAPTVPAVPFAEGALSATVPAPWRAVRDAALNGPNGAVTFDLLMVDPSSGSMITVKAVPADRVSPVAAADQLAMGMAAQGSRVSEVEFDLRDGDRAWFTFATNEGGKAAEGKAVFVRHRPRLLVIIGLWPADKPEAGRVALGIIDGIGPSRP